MATDPTDGTPPPPYDWQSKPTTPSTEAACEQVLRDASKPRKDNNR